MTREAFHGFRSFADGISPEYHGKGLANLTPTLLRHFGLTAERPSLQKGLLPPRFADAERVVLIVADGLGWEQFQRVPAHRKWHHARPITSVLPSTTAAALATLATGVPPAEHGFLGYRTLMPRLGSVVNMVRLRPFFGNATVFEHGLDPQTVFPFTPLVERLHDAGVDVSVITRNAFTMSALSQLTYGRVERQGYVGLGDLVTNLRAVLERTAGERAFIEVYWDEVDTVAHQYGPASLAHDAAAGGFLDALANALKPFTGDGKTVVLLTADHGHVHVPRDHVLNLNAHPEVLDDLVLPPTGEGRFAYLHPRDGTREKVRKAFESAWPDEVTIFDAEDVIDEGCFGPTPHHPELATRVGSLIAIPKGTRKFEYHPTPRMGPGPLLGNHGGVLPGEMLVPLAAL